MNVSVRTYNPLRLILPALMIALNSYSQLSTTPSNGNYSQLVQTKLLGNGVTLLSANYSGSPQAIGSFFASNSNLGISEGIVMTTGNVYGAQGPNSVGNDGFDNGTGGPTGVAYSYLNTHLGTGNFFNASVLTFSFIPQGSGLKFRYVFGSEEYPEFVCSDYNDAFAFLLSGPGFNPPVNLALVPGTSQIVAINSVNGGSPGNYGQTPYNPANCTSLTNTQYYVDNTGGATIQYDGFTKVLTAEATVTPCSTYTITLVVTDVGDGLWDSGVFLEAKSFTTNSTSVTSRDSSFIQGTSDLYEGCGIGKFTFTRSGDLTVSKTVNYSVTGTATNGVDYTPSLPGSVTFAPGQDKIEVTITPIADGITEGDETVTVTLLSDNPCPTSAPPTTTITIHDYSPLAVTAMPDVFLNCYNDTVQLNATVTGGAFNLVSWSTGQVGNPVNVTPTQTTTYTITVLDQCAGTSVSDDVTIHIPPHEPLKIFASPDTVICGGETITLWGYATGGIGNIQTAWSTGESNVTQFTVTPSDNSEYILSATDSCNFTVYDTIRVIVRKPNADFNYYYIQNHEIQTIDLSSPDVVNWVWIWGDGDSSFVQNPSHAFRDTGLYSVTLIVSNTFGCYDTVIKPIRSYPPFEFFIPNAFTPGDDMVNDFFDGKGVGFTDYRMQLYDRWGQLLFESFQYGRGWNGKDRGGKDAPLGVYVYVFDLKTPVGKKYHYVGRVTLVR